jgi:hypothetical protein
MKGITTAIIELFRRKKKTTDKNTNRNGIEREYTFIWYKRMETKNKVHYTQPFRTKIIAKNKEEAKEKLTQFALNKMTLVIIDDDKYEYSEINEIHKKFDTVFKEMENLFKKHN